VNPRRGIGKARSALFGYVVAAVGLVVWLNLLPLSWGIAHGATGPALPPPPANHQNPPAPPPAAPPVSAAPQSFSPAPTFQSFLTLHNAVAAFGSPISTAVQGPFDPQYFEKARLEDHSATEANPLWTVQLGNLIDEMRVLCGGAYAQACAAMPVGGEVSSESYLNLVSQSAASNQVAPPTGFGGGVAIGADGCSAFIPFSAELQPVAGHNVSCDAWTFLQRPDIFPNGWLHDLGLPVTEPLDVTVQKGSEGPRHITLQFFQRNYITIDPQNPAGWQVELGNAGTDRYRLSTTAGALLFGTQ
jgi:hypothetical protein